MQKHSSLRLLPTAPRAPLSVILAVLAAVTTATARIGDTPEQCQARYGKAIERSVDGDRLTFAKAGLIIDCRFTSGKCDAVIYRAQSPSIVDLRFFTNRKAFSMDQAFRLLNLNGLGSPWKQVSKDSYEANWNGIYQTKDEKIHAHLGTMQTSIETLERFTSRKEQIKSEALNLAIASIGAGESLSEPKPIQGNFPPTPEEQEQIDMAKQLDETKRLLDKMSE